MQTPLVSIIIPTYNRARLIGETLDSVVAQTYTNWECIVVDDGSTDETDKLLAGYCKKDSRFQYHHRPKDRPKGANACRNHGFELSKGEYINWFDSDDLMMETHVEILLFKLQKTNADFAVGDCVNFGDVKESGLKPYNFDRSNASITASLFAKNQIGWITDDFLGKRNIVKNIQFNEKLRAGQEYNFFVKLLHQPFKCILLEEVLTYRRVHCETITTKKEEDKLNYFEIITSIKFQTANDLNFFKNKILICWFLSGYMQYAHEMSKMNKYAPNVFDAFKLIAHYFSFNKSVAFIIALVLGKYFNKGYNMMKYART